MPRRSADFDGPPRDFVTGDFLTGYVEAGSPAHYAQVIAVGVAELVDRDGLRPVARKAGVSHSTVLALIAGDRWSDVLTVAKIEEAFDVRLWPGFR